MSENLFFSTFSTILEVDNSTLGFLLNSSNILFFDTCYISTHRWFTAFWLRLLGPDIQNFTTFWLWLFYTSWSSILCISQWPSIVSWPIPKSTTNYPSFFFKKPIFAILLPVRLNITLTSYFLVCFRCIFEEHIWQMGLYDLIRYILIY